MAYIPLLKDSEAKSMRIQANKRSIYFPSSNSSSMGLAAANQ